MSAGITADEVFSGSYERAAAQKVDHMHVGSNPTDHSTLCADALLRVIAANAATGHSFAPDGSY
jgi:hypothetical protein